MALAVTAVPAAAQPASPVNLPVVVTTGQGVVKHAPDRAWVRILAESRARSPRDAQRANADAMSAVMQKLKGAGLPGDAIKTTTYDLQQEFDYNNGRQTLRGYVARNGVEVRLDDIARGGGGGGMGGGSRGASRGGGRADRAGHPHRRAARVRPRAASDGDDADGRGDGGTGHADRARGGRDQGDRYADGGPQVGSAPGGSAGTSTSASMSDSCVGTRNSGARGSRTSRGIGERAGSSFVA